MRKVWRVVGVAALVAALGVAAVVTVAFAEDDDGQFNFRARFKEVLAGLLDVSVEEYDAAVEEARAQVVDEAEAEGWLTEDRAERLRQRVEEGYDPRDFGKGFMGPRSQRRFPAPHKGFVGREGFLPLKVAADLMEMDVRDLVAELQQGESIASMADKHGVTSQAIVDGYVAQLEERLKQPVANGRLTEKMAEAMVEQAKESLPELLERTWEGFGPGGFRRGSQHDAHKDTGRMWGFPGQSDL